MNKPTLHIRSSARGIGDAICGAYVVAGAMNQFSGLKVKYYTRFPEWITPFVSMMDMLPHEQFYPVRKEQYAFDMWKDYRGELKSVVNRKNWLASNIVVDEVEVLPSKPNKSVLLNNLERVRSDEYIVVAPFATHITRMWSLSHVRELIARIQSELRINVVVVSDTMWSEHARALGVDTIINQSPVELAKLLKHAITTVTIDSGIAHFCGLIDARCLSILAIMQPENIYSLTNIQSITPNTKCVFCNFQPARGYDETICPGYCKAINDIKVNDVLERLDKIYYSEFTESGVEVGSWN